MKIARRFAAICLLTAIFGVSLSILVAEGIRTDRPVGSGTSYVDCVDSITTDICLGPKPRV